MADSPFKFLNAFEKGDKAYFFGREKEIADLYEMSFDTRLMMLYGASGAGKTSLVQCGLANKFSETRWKDLYIRRTTNINHSIAAILDKEFLSTGANILGQPETAVEKIEYIYRTIFKPVYLIFDQFEELFLVNPNLEEQTIFFDFLKNLLKSKIACKVILIMREEFIAHLWNYEAVLPSLFNHRYRIEPMRYLNAKAVIENTLTTLAKEQVIKVVDLNQISTIILDKLTKGKQYLELTYLQVYLDQLYQVAPKEQDGSPIFSAALVEEVGSFEDIIGEFLSNQLHEIEQILGKEAKGIPLKILGTMITDEKTKKVLNAAALEEIRIQHKLSETEFYQCIKAFENMRILKRHD